MRSLGYGFGGPAIEDRGGNGLSKRVFPDFELLEEVAALAGRFSCGKLAAARVASSISISRALLEVMAKA